MCACVSVCVCTCTVGAVEGGVGGVAACCVLASCRAASQAKSKRPEGYGGQRKGGQRVVAVAPWLHRNPRPLYIAHTRTNTHSCTHSISLPLLLSAVRD